LKERDVFEKNVRQLAMRRGADMIDFDKRVDALESRRKEIEGVTSLIAKIADKGWDL
jgi:hypothetical protein